MSTGKPQIRVALGTVELTDTDRRAIAWEHDGAWNDEKPRRWILDARGHTRLATRDECRRYVRQMGEHGVSTVVRDFLSADGQTASMEAGTLEQQRKEAAT